MNKEKLKRRAKRFFIAAIVIAIIMFIVSAVHWLFLIPSAVFLIIAVLVFKDIKAIDEEEDEVQEVVNDNLEEKQIKQYGGIRMEMSNEEKAELLEMLGRDEDVNAFVRVTKGQIKHSLFEKIRADLEAKPAEKKFKNAKAEAEKGSKEEDIVVEE